MKDHARMQAEELWRQILDVLDAGDAAFLVSRCPGRQNWSLNRLDPAMPESSIRKIVLRLQQRCSIVGLVFFSLTELSRPDYGDVFLHKFSDYRDDRDAGLLWGVSRMIHTTLLRARYL